MSRQPRRKILELLGSATTTIREIRVDAATVQSQLAIELPPELAQRSLAALELPDDRIPPGRIHVVSPRARPRARKRPATKVAAPRNRRSR